MPQSNLLLAVAVLSGTACGASAGTTDSARPAAFTDDNRSVDTSGGHVTLGLRVMLDTDGDEASRTHIEAVIVDMDGHETVTDLGDFDGIATEVAIVENELGHVRLEGPDGPHELVLMRSERGVEIRLDGHELRQLEVPEGMEVEPQQPFVLPLPGM